MRGLLVEIEFKSAEAQDKFGDWIYNGNKKSDNMGLSSLGLKADTFLLAHNKVLFWWSHMFAFSMSGLLRIALFFVTKRIRKEIIIKRVSKQELIYIIFNPKFREVGYSEQSD